MGILNRFKEIMSANINALLDKAEDPEKMIDQCLRNMQRDLGNVKGETASVIAEEKRAQRELEEHKSEIEKLENYAKKALEQNNEGDARSFLTKKSKMTSELPSLQQAYNSAIINSQNMRKMYDKLASDVQELENRRFALKAKFAHAKAQNNINEMISSSSVDANSSLTAFERYEDAANMAIDKANAMADLNKSLAEDNINNLMDKYDDVPSNSDIDEELERLKKSLNK